MPDVRCTKWKKKRERERITEKKTRLLKIWMIMKQNDEPKKDWLCHVVRATCDLLTPHNKRNKPA